MALWEIDPRTAVCLGLGFDDIGVNCFRSSFDLRCNEMPNGFSGSRVISSITKFEQQWNHFISDERIQDSLHYLEE
jgi:hypothetical protein